MSAPSNYNPSLFQHKNNDDSSRPSKSNVIQFPTKTNSISAVKNEALGQEQADALKLKNSVAALISRSILSPHGLFQTPKSAPTKKLVPKIVLKNGKPEIIFMPEESETPGLKL